MCIAVWCQVMWEALWPGAHNTNRLTLRERKNIIPTEKALFFQWTDKTFPCVKNWPTKNQAWYHTRKTDLWVTEWVPRHPGIHRKTLSQIQKQNNRKRIGQGHPHIGNFSHCSQNIKNGHRRQKSSEVLEQFPEIMLVWDVALPLAILAYSIGYIPNPTKFFSLINLLIDMKECLIKPPVANWNHRLLSESPNDPSASSGMDTFLCAGCFRVGSMVCPSQWYQLRNVRNTWWRDWILLNSVAIPNSALLKQLLLAIKNITHFFSKFLFIQLAAIYRPQLCSRWVHSRQVERHFVLCEKALLSGVEK